MTRVKKAVNALKNRRNVLRQTKGFRHRRSTNEAAANEALAHAGAYAFAHRRDKKGDMRRLWNVKINAALRAIDAKNSYSKFIGAAKKKNIAIDRKILAHLAEFKPEAFQKIVTMVG
jgi:large subunit ribosomal protein L20